MPPPLGSRRFCSSYSWCCSSSALSLAGGAAGVRWFDTTTCAKSARRPQSVTLSQFTRLELRGLTLLPIVLCQPREQSPSRSCVSFRHVGGTEFVSSSLCCP